MPAEHDASTNGPRTEATPDGVHQVQLSNIIVSDEGIAEMQDGRRAVFIARAEVQEVIVGKGIPAERPILHALFGIAMLGVAVSSLRIVREWLLEGGRLNIAVPGGVAMAIFGVWVLWSGFRPRVLLKVRHRGGRRKLVFRGPVDPRELAVLVDRMRDELKYEVRSTVPLPTSDSPYR